MNRTAFEEPVNVLVGLGFPRKIESASEAYQLLLDMRLTAGKAAHKIALRACRAAIDGEIDPQIARSAFVAFARRSAMLLPDQLPFPSASKDGLRPPRSKPGLRLLQPNPANP